MGKIRIGFSERESIIYLLYIVFLIKYRDGFRDKELDFVIVVFLK